MHSIRFRTFRVLFRALMGMMLAALLLPVMVTGSSIFNQTPKSQSVLNAPATGNQATVTIAAASGLRHVADCISYSAVSITAPVQTFVLVILRNGATGVGPVIWQHSLLLTATANTNYPAFSYCGLNRLGSTNTDMTLEFSAGVANVTEVVNLTYYDVAQ